MARDARHTKNYRTTNADMLAYARLIHSHYAAHVADFTAFDADFDAATGAALLAAIDAAQQHGSDTQHTGMLGQATQDAEDKMNECRRYFQGMKYFIERAFPDKPGTWAEFGYNDYLSSRSVRYLMIQFMIELHAVAVKYAAELAGVHFDAAQIAQIQTLANELQALHTQQEQEKGARSTATGDRTALLNECWRQVQRIRKLAMVMYADNWGLWQLYLLPWVVKARKEPVSEPQEGEGALG